MKSYTAVLLFWELFTSKYQANLENIEPVMSAVSVQRLMGAARYVTPDGENKPVLIMFTSQGNHSNSLYLVVQWLSRWADIVDIRGSYLSQGGQIRVANELQKSKATLEAFISGHQNQNQPYCTCEALIFGNSRACYTGPTKPAEFNHEWLKNSLIQAVILITSNLNLFQWTVWWVFQCLNLVTSVHLVSFVILVT